MLTPDWPIPDRVYAFSTERTGGVSSGEYASLNLGAHVGDEPIAVNCNRMRLPHAESAVWLEQVHGSRVVTLDCVDQSVPQADGSYTRTPGVMCTVMTADCLPVLMCDRAGTEIAAVHGGWKSLAAGILSHAVSRFHCNTCDLLVWLGPAIGATAFEVGPEVKAAFPPFAHEAFHPVPNTDKYMADIFQLASCLLRQQGVTHIFGGGECTYSQPERFFSYRRDGQTGRMATGLMLLNK